MRLLSFFLTAVALFGAPAVFPLRDIRPGMKGVGKTVFAGGRVEDFQVEILGVLDNIGPKQSLILAHLSGGPLASTGVMQGMSGSPVYIDGRLVGAVAMAFAYSKEPIAGIRPIEEMLDIPNSPSPARRAAVPWNGELAKLVPPRQDVFASGETRMVELATPVSFGGFTRDTIEHFAPQLRALGLEPRQGIGGGRKPGDAYGDPSALQPGSMISVQLLSGDMSVGADGTITAIDGKQIYAFGHRFLAVGATDLPFARAEVLTLLPNLQTSFKISTAREWMGSITQDRSTAVGGELGRRSSLIPVDITVREGKRSKPRVYRMQMVRDTILSPFLLQMAVFSAIDATERTVGSASFTVSGKMEFENGAAPVRIDNMYSGDFGLASLVSVATAIPLSYVMQSGFDALAVRSISLEIGSYPEKKQVQIDQMWASRREVHPGESVDITVVLAGDNGEEVTRKVTYVVPVGALPGALQFTAADATTANFTDFRQTMTSQPRSAAQLVSFINALHPNTTATIRVWRMEPTYDVGTDNLPGPPPSLGMILARAQPPLTMTAAPANSKVAEFDISADGRVISGSKTIQVEVKE